MICGEPKSTVTYKYCTRCRDEVDRLHRSNRYSVKEVVASIRESLNITVVIKKVEPKKENCPCCWGRKTGEKVVCMFNHCAKVDGLNAGRVRLRGD